MKHQTIIFPNPLQVLFGSINHFSSLITPCRSLPHINQIPAIHCFQHCSTAQKCRFSWSRRTNNRNNLPFFHRNRYILNHGNSIKGLPDMVHFQQLHNWLSSFLLLYVCFPTVFMPYVFTDNNSISSPHNPFPLQQPG